MHWRSGNTTVAISWIGLLRALRSAGLGNIADSIEMQNGVETVSACDYVCTNCTYMKLRYLDISFDTNYSLLLVGCSVVRIVSFCTRIML